MKRRERLGAILALVGALVGIVGTFLLFMSWYATASHAKSAEPGCEILLKYVMPVLSDLGIFAGVLYALSAYGFFTRKGWAFPLVVVANVLALQGGAFLNVPFMAAGLPPVYLFVFVPNLILYFLLMRLVGRVPWRRILLGLAAGMTFVVCLMNGIASLSRIFTIGAPIYVAVQRLHWVAMIGWGVVTVGILLRPKEWMRIVGLGAGLLELVVGIPLVYATTVQLARFSLFSIAPIFSLGLVVVFLWLTLWQWFTELPRVESQSLGQHD
ncbi:MAG: hypothetical protein NTX46_06325 [Chloroflexi bacterium]|nr:hypothetical protein [Chloroflexota bacterium]